MSLSRSTTRLAYLLSGSGLAAVVALVALDRLAGVRFDYPFALVWIIVAAVPAAGIALLFHSAAIDRAGPPPPPQEGPKT
ncbi:hypothetical protein [Hyphobacterium marinum]|uniref:Uncharacterized protein n=1 Tax=Hyphobacterium marinum TaxID=3116574 RepID=A0ABU7M0R3_9PROT|nr:hypothetical protein [Hyphobacterium sp. Y6023]MEE2567404.1 hypothetical protein [Hyphobacterium sp. Y6023]